MIHPLAAHSTFLALIAFHVSIGVHACLCACVCAHICEWCVYVRPHTLTQPVQTSRGVKLNPPVQLHADDVLQWPSCSLHHCN